MKNLLLLLFTVSFYNLSFSQCSPDPLYADSAWGIWPDEQTNFMSGDIGVTYQQIVNFKVPIDAGDIDTTFAGVPVDSVVLNDVTNLPPGISYSCNVPSCTWYGDSAGCASIDGMPTTNGPFQITLDITGWVTISTIFSPPFPYPQNFTYDGYVINIGPVGVESYHLTTNTLKLDNAIPNPANNESKIQFVSGKNLSVNFKLTNLLGETIEIRTVDAVRGVNDILINTTSLQNGVYMYSISDGSQQLTKRLIVNH